MSHVTGTNGLATVSPISAASFDAAPAAAEHLASSALLVVLFGSTYTAAVHAAAACSVAGDTNDPSTAQYIA